MKNVKNLLEVLNLWKPNSATFNINVLDTFFENLKILDEMLLFHKISYSVKLRQRVGVYNKNHIRKWNPWYLPTAFDGALGAYGFGEDENSRFGGLDGEKFVLERLGCFLFKEPSLVLSSVNSLSTLNFSAFTEAKMKVEENECTEY